MDNQTDTITDFSFADNDVIDLSDVLSGISGADANTLDGFLNFAIDANGNTTLSIDVDGAGTEAVPTEAIYFDSANLSGDASMTDVSGGSADIAIINNLLDSGSLVI